MDSTLQGFFSFYGVSFLAAGQIDEDFSLDQLTLDSEISSNSLDEQGTEPTMLTSTSVPVPRVDDSVDVAHTEPSLAAPNASQDVVTQQATDNQGKDAQDHPFSSGRPSKNRSPCGHCKLKRKKCVKIREHPPLCARCKDKKRKSCEEQDPPTDNFIPYIVHS
ncbi:hypothetical protein DFH11DRAFT_256275 [Phellopilus nigrolimitatus]|nr:hypothetical protein DFH11DRAFT_256275 [Phellopilus nigrolimitatus]